MFLGELLYLAASADADEQNDLLKPFLSRLEAEEAALVRAGGAFFAALLRFDSRDGAAHLEQFWRRPHREATEGGRGEARARSI